MSKLINWSMKLEILLGNSLSKMFIMENLELILFL